VSAHRAVAFVVHEQHSKIAVGRGTFSRNAAVHISVAAGLEHQSAAKMIEVLSRVAAFREHRVTRDRRDSSSDHAKRFTRGVRVDGAYANPIR